MRALGRAGPPWHDTAAAALPPPAYTCRCSNPETLPLTLQSSCVQMDEATVEPHQLNLDNWLLYLEIAVHTRT